MQFRINSIDVDHAVYLLLMSLFVTFTLLHFLELQTVDAIMHYDVTRILHEEHWQAHDKLCFMEAK